MVVGEMDPNTNIYANIVHDLLLTVYPNATIIIVYCV